MDKVEYIILRSIIKYFENPINIIENEKISAVDIAIAANHLFQNGYILAAVIDSEKETPNIVLTQPEIEASLDGRISTFYYLTPHGGAYWETIAHPNWDQYFQQYFGCETIEIDKVGEIAQSEIIGADRKLLEEVLRLDYYIAPVARILGTEVWDTIEPWQATYWKSLPKGYRVRYESRQSNHKKQPDDILRKQAYEWYWKMKQWYKDPEFK